jgi:hypothetical protein
VARQGKVKEWHFAHQSRNVHDRTENKCEYSLDVSIRLMIRQLAKEGLKLRTPKLVETIFATSDISYLDNKIDFVVTNELKITFDWIDVGIEFSGVEVDIVGLVERVPFAIYLTYPGREVPEEIKKPEVDHAGVLQINLEQLRPLFQQERKGKYSTFLRSYLEESLEGKSWVYHPRMQLESNKAQARMNTWLSQQQPIENAEHKDSFNHYSSSCHRERSSEKPKECDFSIPENEIMNFKCLICGLKWRGNSRYCQNCCTHFYATEINS